MNIAFYPYWAAKTLLSFINVVYIMVMTTMIYEQTGSALYAALFPFIQMTARIVAGFTSPLLVNRFPFARLMVCIPVAKTLMLTGIAIAFPYLTIHIPALLMAIAILSFLEGWESPLLNTLTPRLVQGEELVKANSLLSFSNQTVTIVGYAMTGFVVVHWGASQTFWAATGMSWTVLILMIAIALLTRDIVEQASQSDSRRGLLREGWLLLWKNRTLRLITFMDLVEGLAGSIWIGAITLAFVKEALGQGENWWGLINSSYSIGTILGGVIVIALASRIQKHLIPSMAIGSLLFSLLTIAYGLNSLPWLALVLCVLMGPAYQIRDVAQQTAFQSSVPVASLSKVYASHDIILSTAMSLSTVIFGLIADQFGVRLVYLIGGTLFIISAICSFGLNRLRQQSSSDASTRFSG